MNFLQAVDVPCAQSLRQGNKALRGQDIFSGTEKQ
jgi:hypothetical protein